MSEDNGAVTPQDPHRALAHPVRRAILLAIFRDGIASPKSFSDSTKGTAEQVTLGVASYHFRLLGPTEFNALLLWKRVPRRGARENLYIRNPASPITDLLLAGDLIRLTVDPREPVLSEGLEQAWPGLTLSLTPILVDSEGKREVEELVGEVRTRLSSIAECSERRLDGNGIDKMVSDTVRIGLTTYLPAKRPERGRKAS